MRKNAPRPGRTQTSAPILGSHLANDAGNSPRATPPSRRASQSGEVQGSIRPGNDATNLAMGHPTTLPVAPTAPPTVPVRRDPPANDAARLLLRSQPGPKEVSTDCVRQAGGKESPNSDQAADGHDHQWWHPELTFRKLNTNMPMTPW